LRDVLGQVLSTASERQKAPADHPQAAGSARSLPAPHWNRIRPWAVLSPAPPGHREGKRVQRV